jgi:hypothetical protein
MDPRTHIVEEFAVSQRVVRAGVEVVPRFKIFAPDGEHTVFVQLPGAQDARAARFGAIQAFMVWKAASGFVLSAELATPDALTVVSVTRTDVIGAIQPIKRDPIGFGPLVWLDRHAIDDTIVSLLPPRSVGVSLEQLELMRRAFEEGSIEGISWQRAGS